MNLHCILPLFFPLIKLQNQGLFLFYCWICEWGLGCTLSVAISLWFLFEFILCLLYQGLRSDAIHSTKEIKYMEWNYKTPHSNSLIWTSLFYDWELISVGLKFSLMFLQIYAGQSIIITQKHLLSDVYS